MAQMECGPRVGLMHFKKVCAAGVWVMSRGAFLGCLGMAWKTRMVQFFHFRGRGAAAGHCRITACLSASMRITVPKDLNMPEFEPVKRILKESWKLDWTARRKAHVCVQVVTGVVEGSRRVCWSGWYFAHRIGGAAHKRGESMAVLFFLRRSFRPKVARTDNLEVFQSVM